MQFNLIKYQEALLLKDDINLLQLRILIYLSHWMGKNNHVWPTNEMILEAMPTSSLDSIKKRIKELDNKGYIEREQIGKKRNIYLLNLISGERFEARGTSQVPQQNRQGDLPSPPRGTSQVPHAPIYNKNKRKKENIPTYWNGFLTTKMNNPDEFEQLLNTPENQWLNCDEFVIYLSRNGVGF